MNPTKEMILQQSYTLFMKGGYEGTSMETIQNQIGISRGGIYHHFKSKEQIFKEVVDEYLLQALGVISSVPKSNRTTLKEAIDIYLGHRKNFMINVRNIHSYEINDFYYFKLAFEAGAHFDDFAKKVKELNELELKGWEEIVLHAKENGEVRDEIDTQFIAKTFMVYPLGLGLEYALYKQEQLQVDEIEAMYYNFYNLIKK